MNTKKVVWPRFTAADGSKYEWAQGTYVGPYNDEECVVVRDRDWTTHRTINPETKEWVDGGSGWRSAEFDYYASNDLEVVPNSDLITWEDWMEEQGPIPHTTKV